DAIVRTVNVVYMLRDGYFHPTAIDKRPVAGTVHVGPLGLAGDEQVDRNHGGPDRAVYVYADEDAAWWSERLEREIPPGLFGENLRTTGLDVTGARVGEQWRVGDEVVLEVRRIRTPCENLALRMGIEGFHLEFLKSGRVGAMCRVVVQGEVRAEDRVRRVVRPAHHVTIGRLARDSATPEQMKELLDSGLSLAPGVRSKAQRVAGRTVTPA
ncbi:MAG TPA: MOSC domain-containing protein, partial [Lapillicoccus sp.]|nr:MOSC domain-containing protein [Lapillicoccus sp.]